MITDQRLFPRKNSQRTRDEWSAKRKLLSELPRDLYAGLTCQVQPAKKQLRFLLAAESSFHYTDLSVPAAAGPVCFRMALIPIYRADSVCPSCITCL